MKKIIFISLAVFLLNPLFLSAASVKVANVIGRAEYRKLPDNKWENLTLSMKLSEGCRIRAGKNSSILLVLDDGSKITLRNMVVFDVKELKTAADRKVSSFAVLYGKMKAVVQKLKRKNDQFIIYTPTAVVGVRGTEFGISVRDENKSRVVVFSGEVEVQNNAILDEKPVIIKSAQTTVIEKDKVPENPQSVQEKDFNEWADKLDKNEKYYIDDFMKW